jgi:hypothetical protein
LPDGKYEIRIVADGEKSVLLRSVALAIAEGVTLPAFMADNPAKLALFISTEPIDKQTATPDAGHTTYEVNDKGIKFLQGVTGEIDRAVIHYKDAYDRFSADVSYELKWRVTLNYARSLHDAVLWNRYDYAADAKRLYENLLKEFDESKGRGWRSPKLSDLGITRAEILEPLRDLKALELQQIYVRAFVKGGVNISRLMSDSQKFVDGFLGDEEGMSKRLKITKDEMQAQLAALRYTLRKLTKPVLFELPNGEYIVKPIVHDAFEIRRPVLRNYNNRIFELMERRREGAIDTIERLER